MRSKPAPERGRVGDGEMAPKGGRVRDGEMAPEGGPVRDGEVTLATFGYLGAIFLGPVIPLVVYALRARRSPFLRYHAATAVNLSITGTLYALCCLILGGVLLLDSITVALVVVVPVGFALWVPVLRYLIRGVSAATRGDRYPVPSWICARILR